jgi:hypothetical protein
MPRPEKKPRYQANQVAGSFLKLEHFSVNTFRSDLEKASGIRPLQVARYLQKNLHPSTKTLITICK